MASDNHHSEHRDDEAAIADRLAALDRDTTPLDRAVTERVHALAAAEFLTAEAGPTSTVQQHRAQLSSESPRRPRHMFTKIAAAVAVAACSLVVMFQLADTSSGNETLAKVLETTLDSKMLKLSITRDGEKAEVHVEPTGRVRWQESPSKYSIANGTRLWQVDETENTVAEKRSPWFDKAEEQVDLLAMLGLEQTDAARFRKVAGRNADGGEVTAQGTKLTRYTMTTTSADEPIYLEALADGNTGLLRSITAWPRGRRSGPPLAELVLVAHDFPVDEEKFVVADSLSEDGRIGKIVDSQGIVSLRPMMASRWTPLARQMLLRPGDWLRTDVRGANAAAFALTSNRKLTAGPGSLLELNGPQRVKLLGGEVKISSGKDAKGKLELIGPDNKVVAIEANTVAHYRVDRDNTLQQVAKPPIWLQGFEGTSNNDSIGSLVTKIDGRDVPLTVGYHKVSVEIRDQIARTTIEESFVNHTDGNLEGVFHFPLPQDASISGFGMWINGELIEADVVEKQRAREIYETILRERRDPGLLEWSGGNLFKARVFPIFPNSEKRIKIVYTQVLPMRANQFRYSYGLRSEMLKTTPLRELSLSVLINSAVPLKSVHSPTHAVREQQTAHSAKLEFTAQEYTPERDFEVVCEVDPSGTDVVVVPHRRGDDGYFMVQLTPPGGEGNWQREIIPDGQPLELLLVCDTSASMDSENRRQQEEFIASVLNALGPKDRFNLAVVDVNTRWLHDDPVMATEETIAAARDHLSERISLGWTDLDRMVESILPRLDARTHVVYVGDGIVTAADADPQAFAGRLRRLTTNEREGTFHAVSVGSTFESTVLKAIAHVGGGSVRQIGGEQTAQQMAFELVNEIAQPGLRNLKVEFRGVQVAAVYPGELPNLAAGTQQILIGRYLPQGEDQSGEIVISGERNGESVSFRSRITLADAESGNSFIPRLWARKHLDLLLEQGTSQAVRDEIIAMSEEFHIITPYTSLLVLESDADRERFKVKRRYEMRDGERFFADGADNANYALRQQQMKRAGDWRLALRRRILMELAHLGRDPQLFQQHQHEYAGRKSRLVSAATDGTVNGFLSLREDSFERSKSEMLSLGDRLGAMKEAEEFNMPASGPVGVDFDVDFDFALRDAEGGFGESAEDFSDLRQAGEKLAFAEMKSLDRAPNRPVAAQPSLSWSFDGLRKQKANKDAIFAGSMIRGRGVAGRYVGGYPGQYVSWLPTLFPEVPSAPAKPAATDPPELSWPDEAIELSKSLLKSLDLGEGGIEITLDNESTDPSWDRLTSVSKQHQLAAADHWLRYTTRVGSPTLVEWYNSEQRGIYSRAFDLGRVRKSVDGDLSSFVAGSRPFADGTLHLTYNGYDVEVERPAANRAVLLVRVKQTGEEAVQPRLPVMRITIDTEKEVVIESASSNGEQVVSTTTYRNHEQLAGVWWPTEIETKNTDGQRTHFVRQQVKQLDQAAFAAKFSESLPSDERAILLNMPMPSMREAEKAEAAGSAGVEDRLMLLLHAVMRQQWDKCFEQFTALAEIVPDRPGLAWIESALRIAARRNEPARQQFHDFADQIVADRAANELYLTNHILDQARQIISYDETLRLLERLRPVYERQVEHVGGERQWKTRSAQALRYLSRPEEAAVMQKAVAEEAPWDYSAQTTYAYDLRNAGEWDAAYAWLQSQLDLNVDRQGYILDQLKGTFAQFLREQGKSQELVDFLAAWVAEDSNSTTPYEQYLGALTSNDQGEQADALALEWLQNAQIEEKLDNPRLARLNTAINYAQGQRYQNYHNYMDPIWFDPLATAALFFLEHEHHFDMTSRIINNHRFRDTDEHDRLLTEVAKRLMANVDSLPVARVPSYVSWVINNSELTTDQWQQIATAIRTRWDMPADPPDRHALGGALLSIYRRHFSDTLVLPFMRERVARSEELGFESYATSFGADLFKELLRRDWSEEHEVEALGLVATLSSANTVAERLFVQVQALHRYVDRMIEGRYQQENQALIAEGHPEEMTRTELAAKRAEFRKAAQESVAARLQGYLDREPDAPQPPDEETGFSELLAWVEIERMYLDLRLDRKQKEVAARLWEMLGDAPPADDADEDADDDAADDGDSAGRTYLEAIRLHRALVMVNYLTARRSAPGTLVTRLEKYLAAGIDREGDAAAPWKAARYRLLIALDRPDDLERDLREWIRIDEFPAPWQLALARLLAERGKIEEAITLMETVEKASQLSMTDYATLADWYLVADNRPKYERAKIETFKVWPENQIRNFVRQHRQRWERSDQAVPSELDENVLFAFKALFEKANQPEHYVYELREFYTACRDFRLLQMLPDSVTGRTPQQVYPLLSNMKSNLMYEIRKEATADEILARLAIVRAESESAIDLRALDLLEVLVERQASEVLNQPGPHVNAAVAALQRAFDREWADGEVRQMASFLNDLGTITQKPLDAERLRQLRALHAMTEPGTDDRLFVAWYLGSSLFHSYSEQREGLAIMANAIGEYEASHAEGWPSHASQPMTGYIDLLEAALRFAVAEKQLTKHVEKPLNESQRHWFVQRRDRMYRNALFHNGRVSLGQGEELYRNVVADMLRRLEETTDDSHRYNTLSQLLSIYSLAKDKKFPTHRDDMREFAFEFLPKLLKRQTNNYQNIVTTTADNVKEILGTWEGLRFVIDRYENYPPRFQHTWNNAWRTLAYRMANWRNNLKAELGTLEPRLLKIVLDELRHDLRLRDQSNRYLYGRYYHSGYYWAEKEADFARVAEEELANRKDSARSVVHIAEYMFRGLHRHDRAIEVLWIAHRAELLNDDQQFRLVEYLRERDRFAETISLLEPLVERRPNAITYRTYLIEAYFHASRGEQMRGLVTATEEHFREHRLWSDSTIASLAQVCLTVKLYTESVAYYEEAIALHQRTAPNRGIGQGTLSYYYTQLAVAYSALGKTREAVDAAAGGVVAWGPRHDNRINAVQQVKQVLQDAKDLDAYVVYLDKQLAETGEDSPLIRKQIGVVYHERGDHRKGITQLELALELQPNDVETHQTLIVAFKSIEDEAAAMRQTLALLDLDRHNLQLYKDLANQLKSDEALSERAATTLVEAAPNEAEHHQALAEFRQQQDRWSEAIDHWKHVAKLRSLEPNGLLKLAEAQIHEKRWDNAKETLTKLNQTDWPSRFGDLRSQLRSLEDRIEK